MSRIAWILARTAFIRASGRSPLHIAAGLNADGIPAPRHKVDGGSGHWKQNTINGNKARGTGIRNNELYGGRRVWNRLRYVKDPITRSRVSRIRPADEWIIRDVPELHIVSEEVWGDVKRRQDAQKPQRQAHWNGRDRNRLSGSQALRRRKYLLSGLLECGICGGKMTVAGTGGHRRYYCANHREKAERPEMPDHRRGVARVETPSRMIDRDDDATCANEPRRFAEASGRYLRRLEDVDLVSDVDPAGDRGAVGELDEAPPVPVPDVQHQTGAGLRPLGRAVLGAGKVKQRHVAVLDGVASRRGRRGGVGHVEHVRLLMMKGDATILL